MTDKSNNEQVNQMNEAPATGDATGEQNGGDGAQTFTQADIDRIVGQRLARERQSLTEQYAEAALDAQVKLLEAAVIAEAGKARAKQPRDAWMLIDQSSLTVGEDGAITGAEDAVKALIDAGRLPTLDKPLAPSTDAGAGSGQKPDPNAVATEEQIEMARKMGVSVDDYMKYKSK